MCLSQKTVSSLRAETGSDLFPYPQFHHWVQMGGWVEGWVEKTVHVHVAPHLSLEGWELKRVIPSSSSAPLPVSSRTASSLTLSGSVCSQNQM